MKSIMQDFEEQPYCIECGSTEWLQCHHCVEGRGRRALSEKYGLKIILCQKCHDKAHRQEPELLKKWQCIGEQAFIDHYKASQEEFKKIFGINFL